MTTRPLHTLLEHLRGTVRRHGDATLTDAQLLERWTAQHDQAAFEVLLWRHGPMVRSTCWRLLRQDADADEAFQATFLVLVRKAYSIRRREALAAWLHRVACRIALRMRTATVRRSSREQPLVDVPAPLDMDETAARDLRALLDEEIDRLPPRYRRAVILCCLEGKSQEEAARLLAAPRGTVSSWLTRARERLRQRLAQRGVVVSVAGLTAALAPETLSAGLPTPLLVSTARIAVSLAVGRVVAAEMLSPATVVLVEGMLRAMLMTKVKIVAVVLAVGLLVGAGVGALSHTTQAADTEVEPTEKQPVPKNYQAALARAQAPLDGIAWGKAAHGLQAGIAFRPGDQESYRIGESVTFVVYLRNVSAKEIRLTHIEPLFAEWMPSVEDAKGNRISVASGPINLGRVPIVHRTVAPGQRITLGYPWFRIRPLGWREKVVGPTCCAASGQYKVGYVGIPLRLNDDKADSSIPVGQVELNIQADEDRKNDRPALNPFNPQMPKNAEKSTDDLIWRKLGLHLRPVGAEAVRHSGSQFRGGLIVTDVRPDSPAERAGIQRDDILVGLHKFEMLANDQVHFVLAHPDAANFQSLKFYTLRGTQLQSGKLQMGE